MMPTILFNHRYIEPALLTADLINNYAEQFSEPLTLIYLRADDETDSHCLELLNRFTQNARRRFIRIISHSFDLPDFARYHFDNSIIAKILIPEIIESDVDIINFDAGIIPGNRFRDFLIETAALREDNCNFVVGAFLEDTFNMPPALAHLPQNCRYPTAPILLFNTSIYKAVNCALRFRNAYQVYRDELVYAEQELLKIILLDGLILNLPLSDLRRNFNLHPDLERNVSGTLSNRTLSNSIYYKCAGSLKPWHYWVLDPNKLYWLELIYELEVELLLREHPVISANRHHVTHIGIQRYFLELYTQRLQSPVSGA